MMSERKEHIAITGSGSISPLGANHGDVWKSYCRKESFLRPRIFDGEEAAVAALSDDSEAILASIRSEKPAHKHLDRTVLMSLHSARQAVRRAGWKREDAKRTGVNIGSSRGATGLLEELHAAYLDNPTARLFPLTSPLTTLGNISSSVAQDVGVTGPDISHSVTCSTALHAVFNGVAWIGAGLSDRFIVGGAEAPLTGFTLAQMKSLRIYTNDTNSEYPSRPCSSEDKPRNMMALGEGAAVFALERMPDAEVARRGDDVMAVIDSIGYSVESLSTATSITEEGAALRDSMRMALKGLRDDHPVDAIVLHAPGTVKGDRSELNAVRAVFGEAVPVLVSNKWFVGHTFGASGALSLEYALLMIESGDFLDFPYHVTFENKRRPFRRIMVNAAGFGGNAASIIVSKPF